MILPDHHIDKLCREGMVTPYDPELLNPASLDVRLGDVLLIESVASPEMVPYPLEGHTEENPYLMRPGQFVLAETMEFFDIPTFLTVEFKLKSSRARERLDHAKAGFGDPGWHGSRLTMEFVNNSQFWPVPLWPGRRVGQMVFSHMISPPERCYRETGRYNNDARVTASKG